MKSNVINLILAFSTNAKCLNDRNPETLAPGAVGGNQTQLNQQAKLDKQNAKKSCLEDIRKCIKIMANNAKLIKDSRGEFLRDFMSQFNNQFPDYDKFRVDVRVNGYNVSYAVEEVKKNCFVKKHPLHHYPQNTILLIQLYQLLIRVYNRKRKLLEECWDSYFSSLNRAKLQRFDSVKKERAVINEYKPKLSKIGCSIESVYWLLDSIISTIKTTLQQKYSASMDVKYTVKPSEDINEHLSLLNKDALYSKLGQSQPIEFIPSDNGEESAEDQSSTDEETHKEERTKLTTDLFELEARLQSIKQSLMENTKCFEEKDDVNIGKIELMFSALSDAKKEQFKDYEQQFMEIKKENASLNNQNNAHLETIENHIKNVNALRSEYLRAASPYNPGFKEQVDMLEKEIMKEEAKCKAFTSDIEQKGYSNILAVILITLELEIKTVQENASKPEHKQPETVPRQQDLNNDETARKSSLFRLLKNNICVSVIFVIGVGIVVYGCVVTFMKRKNDDTLIC
ncbi:hypothetical protein ENBRE01_1823 [Enteropsectra breve]|nr:hypothetical protein ENBRE01_1823 [Enteropsectra breve]